LSGKSSKDKLSQSIQPVGISTKTPAQPLIAGATSFQFVSPGDAESARQRFRDGIRFYSAGELAQAAQSFSEGLARDPNNEWIKKSLERAMAELKLKDENALKTGATLVIPPPTTGASRPLKRQRQALPDNGAIKHKVRTGDTLRTLAEKYYGNPAYWAVIWKHNSGIKNANVLTTGATLVIPELPKTSTRQ
jgi:phage tail protein X